MSKSVTRQIDRISTISPEFGYVASSFDLYLQSVGRADETRSSYMAAVHQLVVLSDVSKSGTHIGSELRERSAGLSSLG